MNIIIIRSIEVVRSRSLHNSRTKVLGKTASHACFDRIEKLYYSAKLSPIHYGQDQPYTSDKTYPQCLQCDMKELVT